MVESQPQLPDERTVQPEPNPVPGQQAFSVNIYPVIYWALTFGAAAGLLLFLLAVLARYITFLWVPVFAVGLVWGAYRNYTKQKQEWYAQKGQKAPALSPLDEFKAATSDIIAASQDMIVREQEEELRAAQEEAEAQAAAEQAYSQESGQSEQSVQQDSYRPPQPPAAPPTPPPTVS